MADLTTLVRVKLRLFPDGASDTDADGILGQLITDCSVWVERFTRRQFTPTTLTNVVFDIGAGSAIAVERGVRSVSALSLALTDQPDDGTGTYTAVSAADILLRPDSLHRPSGWPATSILIRGSAPRMRSVLGGAKATMDVGWAATPADIQSVVDDAVVVAYTSRQGPADSGIGEGAAPSYPWARYFGRDSAARMLLESYRRPGMA